jgi:carbamoyl-phosphate synthase small subunit
MEAEKSGTNGFIVRELARLGSNFRNEQSIQDFLLEQDIPGIEGIDTRALTKILREKGTMNGMITTEEPVDVSSILPKIKEYSVRGVVDQVTTKEIRTYKPGDFDTDSNISVKKKVAILDVGTKYNIVRCLLKRGCEVTVYPARTKAADILATAPDGIMLTNGPGDPKECTEVIEELKKLYASDVPIFAICLGHQLMALANGCDTEKMKYGHRGANHPVKDLKSGRVYISSQNHGYMVKESSIPEDVAEVAFVNVNDGTVEGLSYKGKSIFTVQFHPEACAGPRDSELLFDRFITMMEGK